MTDKMFQGKPSVTRPEVEDFLYEEAALLDAWDMTGWVALFDEGATYYVPPAGAPDDADPSTTLFYVADDYFRLTERAKRLTKRTAHAEYPHSKCRRILANVRILGGCDECFKVTCNFVTYRTKNGITDTFVGHHNFDLTLREGVLKILNKTSFIDTDDISEQGKVSIIL